MGSHVVISRSREKKGPAALQRGDEGTSPHRFALTYPIAAQWAPFLSRYAGEDLKGAF